MDIISDNGDINTAVFTLLVTFCCHYVLSTSADAIILPIVSVMRVDGALWVGCIGNMVYTSYIQTITMGLACITLNKTCTVVHL